MILPPALPPGHTKKPRRRLDGRSLTNDPPLEGIALIPSGLTLDTL